LSKETYTAVYEQDHTGWWFVSVPELPGCHTQGRTLARSRERIREAIALWLDADEAELEIADDVHLPEPARQATARAREARQRAQQAQEAALATTRKAARALVHCSRLSTRDAAELLGISHQRVAQLVAEQGEAPPARDAVSRGAAARRS
jgi:predicted RNase H-like HicB family nuclease